MGTEEEQVKKETNDGTDELNGLMNMLLEKDEHLVKTVKNVKKEDTGFTQLLIVACSIAIVLSIYWNRAESFPEKVTLDQQAFAPILRELAALKRDINELTSELRHAKFKIVAVEEKLSQIKPSTTVEDLQRARFAAEEGQQAASASAATRRFPSTG